MNGIFYLTEKQEKAFKQLKKAFKECEKSGIHFVNTGSRMSAYNSKYVSGSTDIQSEGDIPNEMANINNFEAPINQWIDCEVYLVLTEDGKKELLNEY